MTTDEIENARRYLGLNRTDMGRVLGFKTPYRSYLNLVNNTSDITRTIEHLVCALKILKHHGHFEKYFEKLVNK